MIIARYILDQIIFGWTQKGLIDMDRALSSITSCVTKVVIHPGSVNRRGMTKVVMHPGSVGCIMAILEVTDVQ